MNQNTGENQNISEKQYSARRPLLVGGLGVFALVGGLFGWGLGASVDSAVVAPAQVTVEAGNRPIEHIDGGIVAEVFVSNGDNVAVGDPLLRFAVGQADSELQAIGLDLAGLQARRNRLEAELHNQDAITWDAELLELVAESLDAKQILDEEELAFATRVDIHAQLIELLQTRVDAAVGPQEAAELEAELLKTEAERADEIEAQLQQVRSQSQDIARRQRSVRAQAVRREVLAPVSGTVFGLTVSGVGDVVRPAEPLLYIVPDDSALILVAQIQPNSVDRVYAGQEAAIRFPAFEYQITPERNGRVMKVSADTFTEPRTGRTYYEAEIAIDAITQDGEGGLPLIPGMPAEVLINTGDRSVISYLTKPVTDFFSGSLREE